MRKGLLLIAMGWSLSACVSRDAGVREARAGAADRYDLDAREHDEASEEARARLLARPITDSSAAQLAVLGSPNADAVFAAIGTARAAAQGALRLPNPKLDGGLVFYPNETRVALGGDIDLTELLLMPLRADAANAGLDAATLEATGRLVELALAAKLAYYDYQSARRALELERAATYASAQTSALAKRIEEAGNTPSLAALEEQALYEEARLSLARAELREGAARERLSVAMGLHGPATAAWTAVATLPDPPAKEIDTVDAEQKAIASSLDLEMLRASRDAGSRAADSAAARGVIPEISAGIGAEREGDEWGVGPRIGLELPIFYQGQGEVGAAEARMKVADAQLEATAVRVRGAARSLVARLEGARSAALFYRDTFVPLRKRIVAETLVQYNAMTVSAFQLVSAKRAELDAERAAADALATYWSAHSELEILLKGKLPDGALAMPAPRLPNGRADETRMH